MAKGPVTTSFTSPRIPELPKREDLGNSIHSLFGDSVFCVVSFLVQY